MKALSAILISFLFLLTTMQQTSFYLLYKLNEKSITEKYCVNKNVKGSCCHGSCHLNKTIAKTENESTKNPLSAFNLKGKEIEIYLQQLQKIQNVVSAIVEKPLTHKSNFFAYLSKGFYTSLIKPPAVLG